MVGVLSSAQNYCNIKSQVGVELVAEENYEHKKNSNEHHATTHTQVQIHLIFEAIVLARVYFLLSR